jgi:uncharacterized protein (TIGR02147 family)
MTIYEFEDYKKFLRAWIEAEPKAGRGLIRKMADHLRVSSTMMSHILSGDKHFSFEAANELALFIGLEDAESDYFLLLLSYAKAGSFSLQERFKKKIIAEQKKSKEVTKRVKADADLPETAKTIFYSNWLYAGVRNMTACPGMQNVDEIASHLNLPRASIKKVIDFLLRNGLSLEENGKIVPGPKQTHISHQSPLVSRHHQNWRLQGFSKMIDADEKNLFFTAPMSLSHETSELIRHKIPFFIEDMIKLVRPSKSEVVRCLNIDWFGY